MFEPFTLSVILMILLAVFGLSIGISMLVGTILYLGMAGWDTSIAAETVLQGLFNTYTLLAIPLFILAADIMNVGSLSDRLLRFSEALVGRFRGGLGHVNVVASLIFSGMSGSAVADAVGMGKIVINMMTKDGKYTKSYAAAITAATATVGPIIPPSLPMVMYSLVSDASIGFLFAAGILPGLLMGLCMAGTNAFIAHKRNFPVEKPVPLRELPRLTWQAFPALMLPVILLGGIYGGIMTPTEAAAVAAFYALIISVLFYRSVSFKAFFQALKNSSRSSAAVGVLIMGAIAFNYVITRENIPVSLAAFMAQYDLSPLEFLLAINVLFLLLGCALEPGPILLIIVPIFIPTVNALGIDLVHFGVIVVINAMIGLVTPPVGMLLFIVTNITKAKTTDIIKDVLPFLFILILALLVVTIWEDFVLFLPRLVGYTG